MPNAEQQPDLDQLMEEWREVVNVQMHFNDLIMRFRQIVMTAVLGVFGAAAFSLQFPNLLLHLLGRMVHASAAIILFGIGLLFSMLLLDRSYYFKLLLGAVNRGKKIEELLQSLTSNKLGGLTLEISKAVKEEDAKFYLLWFYAIPMILGFVFFLWVILGYPPRLIATEVPLISK